MKWLIWADVLIFVIPSAFMHSELEKLTLDISNKIVVSAVKGIIPETGKLVGEHFHDEYNIPLKILQLSLDLAMPKKLP